MQLDFRRLGAFVAAFIVYVLLSPVFGFLGTLVILGVSSALVGAFTSRSFNQFLAQNIKPRKHRELLFHFASPFVAFAASDVFKVGAYMGGVPYTMVTVLSIVVFFALIILLDYKVFTDKVSPRMP